MKNLRIDEQFKSLIPNIQSVEYAALEKSILEEGVRDPIHVWDSLIVDGHNRFQICQEHGLECPSREIKFASREDAMIWIIRNQFARRNISAFQRSALALKLEPLIREKAREKEHERKTTRQKSDKSNMPVIDTKKELAKAAGVSHDTIMKVKKIQESGNEEVIKKIENREISINRGFQEVRGPARPMRQLSESEKETMEKLKIMIVDEMFSTIQMRFKGIKSRNELRKNISELIRKLSAWNEEL